MRSVVAPALLVVLFVSPSFASKVDIKPGQWQISANPEIQEICLKPDGTWYGTTFNFDGYWISHPLNNGYIVGAIYGNYSISGKQAGYANDAITISKFRRATVLTADWYDWYDDNTYRAFVTALGFLFKKKDCDPPFQGENTHAATE
jgi:hypothetical protein